MSTTTEKTRKIYKARAVPEPPDEASNITELTKDQIRDYLQRDALIGRPICVEHNRNLTIGEIVHADEGKDGSLYVMFDIYDNDVGNLMREQIDSGKMMCVSLSHFVGGDPVELSVCMKGARPGSFIFNASEDGGGIRPAMEESSLTPFERAIYAIVKQDPRVPLVEVVDSSLVQQLRKDKPAQATAAPMSTPATTAAAASPVPAPAVVQAPVQQQQQQQQQVASTTQATAAPVSAPATVVQQQSLTPVAEANQGQNNALSAKTVLQAPSDTARTVKHEAEFQAAVPQNQQQQQQQYPTMNANVQTPAAPSSSSFSTNYAPASYAPQPQPQPQPFFHQQQQQQPAYPAYAQPSFMQAPFAAAPVYPPHPYPYGSTQPSYPPAYAYGYPYQFAQQPYPYPAFSHDPKMPPQVLVSATGSASLATGMSAPSAPTSSGQTSAPSAQSYVTMTPPLSTADSEKLRDPHVAEAFTAFRQSVDRVSKVASNDNARAMSETLLNNAPASIANALDKHSGSSSEISRKLRGESVFPSSKKSVFAMTSSQSRFGNSSPVLIQASALSADESEYAEELRKTIFSSLPGDTLRLSVTKDPKYGVRFGEAFAPRSALDNIRNVFNR